MEYGPLKIEYAYHTRILFFEEYVRILTYSIIAYAYARALGKLTGQCIQGRKGQKCRNYGIFVKKGAGQNFVPSLLPPSRQPRWGHCLYLDVAPLNAQCDH